MDWVQLHLALNHVPVVGIPLVVLWLGVGWLRKSAELTRLAVWFLMVLCAAAIAIKFTGDFAAEQAAPRLAAEKELVLRHEESGDQVTAAVFVLGLLAVFSLWLGRAGRAIPNWILALLVAVGLITCGLYARSAHTGGQISHSELR